MPINVVLQQEGGKVLEQVIDFRADLATVWPIDNPSFPLLQYIDPYGNTFFNGRQMPQVIRELNSLIGNTSNDSCVLLLRQVEQLAERCRDNPHEYLRFEGD